MINFNVQEPYKTHLLSGQKTVEWRLKKGKFADLKVGDRLQFDDTGEIFVVERLASYPSFEAMLEAEGVDQVLPWIEAIKKWVELYYQFYSPAQEAEFWVLALQLKLIHL